MRRRAALWLALVGCCGSLSFARVLDDFDDGVRTGWFDFVTGLGGGVSEGFGVLTFDVPAGRAQGPVFVATSRAGERMVLEPGQPLELRATLAGTTHPKAFAVLAWVPDNAPLSHFAGYFIAKSATEVRVGRALGDYYTRENPPVPLKQEDVTLALSLTTGNVNVTVRAQVLDREAGDAVLFDRVFGDTAPPWLGSGQFALFGYWEGDAAVTESVQVFVDQTEVNTPVPANLRPVFHGITPTNTASFVPLDTRFILHATDDQPWWGETAEGIAGFTDGPFSAQAIGPVTGTQGKTLQANCLANLRPNTNYTVRLVALDANQASNVFFLRFDTFCASSRVIESEDYNFGGGKFLDLPRLLAESAGPTHTAYPGQVGVSGIDYRDMRISAGGSGYRPADPVGIKRSLDYRRPWFVAAGDESAEVFDYDVHEIEAGEYLVYTRTFGPGDYTVYLRVAVLNLDRAEATLERVTRTPEGGEVVTELGWFVARRSGFEYCNVPLTDAAGQPVKVRLSGPETLRLRQWTTGSADAAILQNYLMFASPAADCVGVESAPAVDGPFAPDPTVHVTGHTVTVWLPASDARFYRCRAATARRIINLRRMAEQLTFDLDLPP
ncbi:MAG: hypothetical protein HS113_15935 [Verrucomicrobiales bacterium]|nr:hypothetical protein [Verrucomicrobiales bacterium]